MMNTVHQIISEQHILIFLMQFAIILGACKLLGLVFERLKQSTVTADIIIGLILGPAVLGKYLPELQQLIFPQDIVQMSMLETIAWLGKLFLLMEIGLEVNFSKIWKHRSNALKMSFANLTLPLLICFIPIYLLPDNLLIDPSHKILFSIFISVIMTISALPTVIRTLRELNILKSDMGFTIVSALTFNDLIGWIVFATILGIFTQNSINLMLIIKITGLTLLFTVLSFAVFRRLIDRSLQYIHQRLGAETGFKTTFVILIGLLFGAITMKIGVHSLLGFFIAGIVVGESKYYTEKDRHVITQMVYSIFIPVFFANIGLHLNMIDNFNLGLIGIIFTVGVIARFTGAYLGALWTKQDQTSRIPIAICNIAGGEMHIVVSMLAYSSGLISEQILVAIIMASLFSTIIFSPWLSLALRKMKKGVLNFIFGDDSIFLDLDSSDKFALLERLSGFIAEKTSLDRSIVLEEILNRETSMPSSVGKGIAFPHARLQNISHPLLVFVRSAHGIEWDSPDGKPVYLVFLIITPRHDEKAQLHILQSISKTMRLAKNQDLLLQTNNKAEILKLLSLKMLQGDSFLITS